MRGLLILVLLFLPALELRGQTRSVKDLLEGPETPAPSAKESGPGETLPGVEKVIAQVNNQEVLQRDFFKILYGSAGVRVLRQLVGLELAKQMAAAEGVEPGPKDIDREFRVLVDQLGPEKDALGKPLSLDDRRRLLRGILQRRGIGFDEFQLGIKEQAYLRAITRKRVKITDDLLKDEFQQVYGRKRQVRAIVVPDLQVGQEVFNRLTKGEKFEVLAGKYSIDLESASLGGQIGGVGPTDTKFPAVVVKTVYSLAVGKFSSPIRLDDRVWIIKVDRDVPPMSITFDQAREQLTGQLQRRLEDQMMVKVQTELFRRAKIKVNDKLLAKEFDRWMKEFQAGER